MYTFSQLWWVFPASIVFSTVAIGSGVSGALFFSPFFMLVVGLTPVQAVGAGLLTEVFGMGNGLRSYVRAKLVDYATARWLLLGSVPAVVLGAVGADMVSDRILKGIFGIGLLVLAAFLILVRSPEQCEPGDRAVPLIDGKSEGKGTTVVRARDGSVYEYPTCWRPPGVLMAAVGGVLTGMISAGLPEISTTQLVVRCRIPPRVAIATSVFTLAVVAAVGAGIHALSAQPVWQVVGWSIPGVLIGSTIGSRVGKYLPAQTMERRLYSASGRLNEVGQYAYYGRVGGCLITGNEDGAKHCAMNILYSLQHLGYAIPPQADAAGLGEVGPGPSYLDPASGGPESDFTNRNTTFMTWNLLHLARLIKDAGGVPAHGNQRSEWDAGCRFDHPNPLYR